MKRIVPIVLVAVFALVAGSCDILGLFTGGGGGYAPEPDSFSIDLFEQNLIAQVGTQWVGYAYAINRNGQLVASDGFGDWVRETVSADTTTPIYGASINKLVTAIGVMKALQLDPGIDLDDTIDGYLPDFWSPAGGGSLNSFIRGVTIRELLSHTSGIPGPTANTFDSDYATLKDIAQNGLGQAPAAGVVYSNANYGFLRIFLATVNNASYSAATNDTDLENIINGNYRDFMEREVFDLAGVGGSGVNPTLTDSVARYYQWNDGQVAWAIGNRSANLGSGGYYFSVRDLAQLLAWVNHSEQIISSEMRDLLYDNIFGLSDGQAAPQNPNGAHGFYYSKAGALISNNRGVRNIVAILPLGVEVVFMANSRGGAMDGTAALQNAIFAAYDAAWE
ncbi:MAG TPA: serine hydrolase domain-containing protein [Spirochaetia bacterium]|nr:serine hydrolase domain-containing protein [Spirochaetia bacterium]